MRVDPAHRVVPSMSAPPPTCLQPHLLPKSCTVCRLSCSCSGALQLMTADQQCSSIAWRCAEVWVWLPGLVCQYMQRASHQQLYCCMTALALSGRMACMARLSCLPTKPITQSRQSDRTDQREAHVVCMMRRRRARTCKWQCSLCRCRAGRPGAQLSGLCFWPATGLRVYLPSGRHQCARVLWLQRHRCRDPAASLAPTASMHHSCLHRWATVDAGGCLACQIRSSSALRMALFDGPYVTLLSEAAVHACRAGCDQASAPSRA